MKFCIANTSYWESIGYNPIHWRKSTDGTKALCHLEYGEILAKNLDDNPNVEIFGTQDERFQGLLNSSEWSQDGTEDIIEDNSLVKKVADLEEGQLSTQMGVVELYEMIIPTE